MTEENKIPVPPSSDTCNKQLLLDQYKAYLSDLGNVGTRFTTMTTYYVSVVAALIGLLALKDKPITEIDGTILYLVCAAGTTLSVLWWLNVGFFGNLFRAKISVLKEMEIELPFQAFEKEWKAFTSNSRVSWSHLESFIPLVFAVFFLFIALARLESTWRSWCP
jgi:hypothetical protein